MNNKKLKIILTMCFFDNNNIVKKKITKLQMKYYLYLRNLFKDRAEINFLLVGSEGIKSKEFVYNLGFRENEYIEYKQIGKNILKIIENKHNFAYKTAINLYPDLDILITNGSSDFIPKIYFENLFVNFNKDEPQIYGINGFSKKGSVFILNNNFNEIYHLWNMNNPRIKSMLFIGGIYGFNKKLLENLNYNLKLPNGNEYVLEKNCIEKGKAKPYYNCDYFINFKIKNMDFTSFDIIKQDFKPTKLELKDISKKKYFYKFYNILVKLYKDL